MARQFKKIRILFTIPDFDTAGSGKALLKIATRLDTAIFEPHIACMHEGGLFFEIVKNSGIPIHIIQYTTPMKPYHKGILNCIKISKKIRKIAPDIIHSFHYSSDYSEPLAAKLAGIKWIYSKKNMSWGGSSKNSWKLRTFLASHIIYQNTDMKNMFFPKSNKTTLIPRGVDIEEFYPFKKNIKLLENYKISIDDRLIIVVANLVPLKGVDVLINAFNLSGLSTTNWKLLIVGDNQNEHGKDLQQLVKQLNLINNVIFTGKVLNVNEHLNLAEIFVLPTIEKGEGSPVALLEAMATGLCALGSNLPGIKDQLSNYPEHLVEAGNISKWTEALLKFCNLPKEYLSNIGNTFLNNVVTSFTLNSEVKSIKNLYLKLLK